jgi:hypothetical protein
MFLCPEQFLDFAQGCEAQPDHSINQRAISVTNLVAVPEDKWQTANAEVAYSKKLFPLADHNRLTALSQAGRFSILDL